MKRTARVVAVVALGSGLGGVAGLCQASVVLVVLGVLLATLGAALAGPRRFGLLLLMAGYGLGTAISDSNISSPIVDLSGVMTLTPLKVAPYALMLAGVAIVLVTSGGPVVPAQRWLGFGALALYLGLSGLGMLFPGASPIAPLRLLQGLVPLLGAVVMTRSGWARWPLICVLAAAGYIVLLGVGLLAATGGGSEMASGRLGAFTHPVMTSFAGALLLGVALHGVLARRYVIPSLVGMAMGAAVIWASRGRAGFIAAVAMGAVLLSHRFLGAGNGRFRATLIASACIGYVLLLGDGVWSWFTRGRPEELETFTGRTSLWRLDLSLIAERPLVGWGPGLLRAGPVAEKVKFDQLGFGGHAHNAFLEATLSAGVIGGILWLLAVVWTGRQLGRGFRAPGYPSLRLLAFALWLGVLWFSFTEGSPAGFGLGWFLLCALVAEASSRPEEIRSAARFRRRPALGQARGVPELDLRGLVRGGQSASAMARRDRHPAPPLWPSRPASKPG